jgi:hypothetical protein
VAPRRYLPRSAFSNVVCTHTFFFSFFFSRQVSPVRIVGLSTKPCSFTFEFFSFEFFSGAGAAVYSVTDADFPFFSDYY